MAKKARKCSWSSRTEQTRYPTITCHRSRFQASKPHGGSLELSQGRGTAGIKTPFDNLHLFFFCLPSWNSSNLLSPQPYQKALHFHTHLAIKWMSIPASGLFTMERSTCEVPTTALEANADNSRRKMDRLAVYSPSMLLRTNPVCQWQKTLSESYEHYDTPE